MKRGWKTYPMFCPNCGAINHGHKSEDEKIRYECRKCTVKFVRVPKGRRHDTIELFAALNPYQVTRFEYFGVLSQTC